MAAALTILLMRHAHASAAQARESDSDRRLDERGRAEAMQMGRALRERNLLPDWAITSTARRAEETLSLVLNACGYSGRSEQRSALYLADPSQILEQFLDVEDGRRCVLVVGHNPGMGELVSEMTGEFRSMPTAGIAQILVDVEVMREVASARIGRLEHFFRPGPLATFPTKG